MLQHILLSNPAAPAELALRWDKVFASWLFFCCLFLNEKRNKRAPSEEEASVYYQLPRKKESLQICNTRTESCKVLVHCRKHENDDDVDGDEAGWRKFTTLGTTSCSPQTHTHTCKASCKNVGGVIPADSWRPATWSETEME